MLLEFARIMLRMAQDEVRRSGIRDGGGIPPLEVPTPPPALLPAAALPPPPEPLLRKLITCLSWPTVTNRKTKGFDGFT